MHYAVPRLLYAANGLERLYTDFYLPRAIWKAAGALSRFGPDLFRRGLGRFAADLPPDRVVCYPRFALSYAVRRRRTPAAGVGDVYLWAAKEFGRRAIGSRARWGEGVYCFNGAAREILSVARDSGKTAVLEQTIAPLEIELDLVNREREAFPEWEGPPSHEYTSTNRERFAREADEWRMADVILCGSDFVLEGVRRLGGPAERCVVVPYGVDLPTAAKQKARMPGPLRILTVGTVGLRKGSPYVFEAARRLGGAAEFRMVGSISAASEALSKATPNVELIGAVPRAAVAEHYAWADVFVLPSICEGSATVTYEAMAQGLPVVCTPNTGSIVREGESGFVIPAHDPDRLVERLLQLIASNELLAYMSRRALELSVDASLRRYGERLRQAIGGPHP